MKKSFKLLVPALFAFTLATAFANDPVITRPAYEEMSFETIGAQVPYRLLMNKDPQGFNIELDDGAIWRIPDKSSARTVSQWRLNDSLVIHPALFSNWSGARFFIFNERTRDTAYAELSQGPLLGTATHNEIAFIDYRTGDLQICDGLNRCAYWHVDRSDRNKLDQWRANQTIILGSNENCYAGWFSSSEYILINVERNEFVRAHILN